jgi:NADPH2:quinone reductase
MHTYALPSSISDDTAAAGLLQGLTALTLIRDAHKVEKGDWVLVHAAAGGMGLWLCQLLKAVGARTIGTASTEEKREIAKKAGAEVVLEYPEIMGKDAFVAKIKELTGGKGVPVVFDGVGKSTFDVDLEVVALQGSVISFGNASGAVPPFSIARLSAKNVRLMRPTLFGFISTREEFEKYTKELFEMVEGGVDVSVYKTYALKDVAQAHQDIEGRKTTGKLLLRP